MKFVLLLTLWASDSPKPEVWVLDSGLSGEQCIAQMEAGYSPTMMGILSCEVDHE